MLYWGHINTKELPLTRLRPYHGTGYQVLETLVEDLTSIEQALYDLGYISLSNQVVEVNVKIMTELDRMDQMDYDHSCDGDAASALASVGWGLDEDYGYQGDSYEH